MLHALLQFPLEEASSENTLVFDLHDLRAAGNYFRNPKLE